MVGTAPEIYRVILYVDKSLFTLYYTLSPRGGAILSTLYLSISASIDGKLLSVMQNVVDKNEIITKINHFLPDIGI